MMTKRIFFALCMSLSGCAGTCNRIEADGGIIGSYPGHYIVVNHSGGRVMDVWRLPNMYVNQDEHTAGWLFKDADGRIVHIGGDVKVTRIPRGESDPLWGQYEEYHAEFDARTYQEAHPASAKGH